MDLSQLLALPLSPCLRLWISPTEQVEIDVAVLEAKRQELIEYCRSLPGLEQGLLSWQLVKLHTEGNGYLAKLLIALGEHLGVWKMHPSPLFPELWLGQRLYPMLQVEVLPEPPRRVPKPSAGDLEKGLRTCDLCHREIAPEDSSSIHDPNYCEEERCPMEGGIKEAAKKEKLSSSRAPTQQQESLDEAAIESLLSQVNGTTSGD